MKKLAMMMGACAMGVCCLNLAATAETLSFVGTCDRNPLEYRLGEEMTFTVTLVDLDDAKKPVAGRPLVWKRQGDDGQTETGKATSDRPLVVKTRLAKPGFVRLTVNVLGADGKNVRDEKNNRDVTWDGGAGADVWNIPAQPIPADFDAFWDRQVAALRSTPAKATLTPLETRSDKVAFAKFLIPLDGDDTPAQGLVAWPKDAKKGALPIEIRFDGYGFGATSFEEHKAAEGDGRILVAVTRHGEDPRREPDYYENVRTNACKNFCFRANDGAPEKTDYFRLLMRDLRALQWAKTLPQWNGREIRSVGGSMGAYQSLAVAALDADVTEVKAGIPWCADFAGPAKFGRLGGWFPGWTPALDYFALSHFATRVRCPVKMDIGLGDYACPPSGEILLYRNLKGPKSLVVKQNMGHGCLYGPDVDVFRLEAPASPATPLSQP